MSGKCSRTRDSAAGALLSRIASFIRLIAVCIMEASFYLFSKAFTASRKLVI
jgi:hypothetical protein